MEDDWGDRSRPRVPLRTGLATRPRRTDFQTATACGGPRLTRNRCGSSHGGMTAMGRGLPVSQGWKADTPPTTRLRPRRRGADHWWWPPTDPAYAIILEPERSVAIRLGIPALPFHPDRHSASVGYIHQPDLPELASPAIGRKLLVAGATSLRVIAQERSGSQHGPGILICSPSYRIHEGHNA